MTANLTGKTLKEQQLWNTYMFWARLACDPKTPTNPNLEISKHSQRVRASTDKFLQAIVFIAFAVESRLKAVYDELGIAKRKRDTLGVLIKTFRHRVEMERRLDGKGLIRLPAEWGRIEKILSDLNNARNEIAHGNYQSVLTRIPRNAHKAKRVSARYFNTLVDVIRVTHQAIGNISPPIGSRSKARFHYRQLKVYAK